MLDIFLIFEMIYEIWSLLHFISDPDEMNRFRNLSFDRQIRELKFRIFPFMLKVAAFLYALEKMRKKCPAINSF